MTSKLITPKTLANSFGTDIFDLTEGCLDLLDKMNNKYTIISGEEREKLIIQLNNKIKEARS